MQHANIESSAKIDVKSHRSQLWDKSQSQAKVELQYSQEIGQWYVCKLRLVSQLNLQRSAK